MNELTNVTTGKARLSYVHLFKPYAAAPGQEEKFSVTVLVPKSDVDTMNRINAAIEAAKQRGTAENGTVYAHLWYQHQFMTGMVCVRQMGCHLEQNVKVTGCSRQVQKQIIHRRW